jgi:hypothetical protein
MGIDKAYEVTGSVVLVLSLVAAAMIAPRKVRRAESD